MAYLYQPGTVSGIFAQPRQPVQFQQRPEGNAGTFSFSSLPTPSPISFGQGGGLFNNFTTGLNTFGAEQFGLPATGGSIVGPASGATLAQNLGGAGVGLTGGQLANSLLGGTATGGTIGSGLGTAIGAMTPLGPVGAAIGGTLGGAIGGLFGNDEPPMVASQFLMNVGKGADANLYDFSNTGYGTKTSDESRARAVQQDFSNYLTELSKATGVNFTGAKVAGGFNDKYMGGHFLKTQNTRSDSLSDGEIEARFNPNDPNSVNEAYRKIALGLLEGERLPRYAADHGGVEFTPLTDEQRSAIMNFRYRGPGGQGAGLNQGPMLQVPTREEPTFRNFLADHQRRQREGAAQ